MCRKAVYLNRFVVTLSSRPFRNELDVGDLACRKRPERRRVIQDVNCMNGLLIVADAAADIISGVSYEAYLRSERIIGARLWTYLTDLGFNLPV